METSPHTSNAPSNPEEKGRCKVGGRFPNGYGLFYQRRALDGHHSLEHYQIGNQNTLQMWSGGLLGGSKDIYRHSVEGLRVKKNGCGKKAGQLKKRSRAPVLDYPIDKKTGRLQKWRCDGPSCRQAFGTEHAKTMHFRTSRFHKAKARPLPRRGRQGVKGKAKARRLNSYTLYHMPYTLNPKPQTLNPEERLVFYWQTTSA